MVRKLKIKKNRNAIKNKIAVIGTDSENEYIFQHIKTRSFLDKTFNSIMSNVRQKYKLPKILKKSSQLSKDELKLFEISGIDLEDNKFVERYNTEDPKFKEVENEIKKLEIIAQIVSYFDMDAKIYDEDDNEMTYWEAYGVNKNDYLGLCKYLISEEGLGISEASLNIASSEIARLNSGEQTLGEKLLEQQDKIESEQRKIEELEGDSNVEELESESE